MPAATTARRTRAASLRSLPLDALRERVAHERARRRFAEFVRQAWPYVPQVDPLVWSWHLDAICLHYEAVARGEIRRLLVNVCPGSAKSVLQSVLWPAWIWTWWPECQFLSGSYRHELAERDALRCRAVVESGWYRQAFSAPAGWSLRADQNRKDRFANTAGGERYALSTGAGGTGERAHVVGIDDPLNAIDALSRAERERATLWLGQTISQRFVNPDRPRFALVMQRLHEEDPAAWLLAGGDVEHLCLPSEYVPERRARTYRRGPDGERTLLWEDPRTVSGELLFPARFSAAVLADARKPNALGEEGYASQHQQLPTPAGGNLFRLSDWRFWKPDGGAPDHSAHRPRGCYDGPAAALPPLDRVIVSVDATFRRTASGSYVAIHVWGASGAGRYLLDRVHERMDFDHTVQALLGVIARWPEAREKVIEGKANGDAIISTLTQHHGISGVVAENPGSESKEQRASAMLPYQRAGNVYLPDGAPWLEEYVSEHAAFPLGQHDDDVDAQSQALRHLEREASVADHWTRAFSGGARSTW